MSEEKNQIELDLIEMTKQKEEADKRLLDLEIVIGILGVGFLLVLVLIASFIEMETWLRIVLIIVGVIPCVVACLVCIKIEQVAGFYECAKCHHRYVPTYKQTSLSMHMGRTKYLKCPHCNQKSWSKKVISKKD